MVGRAVRRHGGVTEHGWCEAPAPAACVPRCGACSGSALGPLSRTCIGPERMQLRVSFIISEAVFGWVRNQACCAAVCYS